MLISGLRRDEGWFSVTSISHNNYALFYIKSVIHKGLIQINIG